MKSAFANLPVSWPKAMKIGPGPLFPNADTINFDDEHLPAVMVHRGIHLQITYQSGGEFRKNFCVIVHLQRDNSFVVLGWIVDDVIWEKSPFKDRRMASISWAFVMTTMSDDSTGKTSFNRKTS
jgi:hypothetical protein